MDTNFMTITLLCVFSLGNKFNDPRKYPDQTSHPLPPPWLTVRNSGGGDLSGPSVNSTVRGRE